jgi:hypothetical protein
MYTNNDSIAHRVRNKALRERKKEVWLMFSKYPRTIQNIYTNDINKSINKCNMN